MVYRPNDNHTNELQLVQESIKTVSVRCRGRNRIMCEQELLPRVEWFAIQEGDIVATCLPRQRPQFQILSREYEEDEDDETTEIFQYKNTDCGTEQLLIDERNLSPRKSLQLHLSAELLFQTNDHVAIPEKHPDRNTYYLKTIPPSTIGPTVIILIVIVVVVGIALTRKRKQNSGSKPTKSAPESSGHTDSNGVANDIYSTPQRTRTKSANIYAVRNNVAYNVNALQQTVNLTSSRDTYGYEIV